MFIEIAHAAIPSNSGMTASGFALKLAQVIGNPLIVLMAAIALFVFLWGVAEYIRGADNETERTKGASHMLWGLIGLFIMVSAYTILKISVDTVFGK